MGYSSAENIARGDPKCNEFQDFEVEHNFLSIGRRTMLLNAKKLHSESNKPEMILLMIEDTTERNRVEAEQFKLHLELKNANEALRALVLIDDLTGLYNRRGFLIFAKQQMKLARRNKRELLLVFVDLDGLKQINDTFGHQEGDRALVKTAEILKDTFRAADIIARLGGDEFTVLATVAQDENADILVNRLHDKLGKYNALAMCAYDLSISVGVARFDAEETRSIEEMLVRADAAMYEDKRNKKLNPLKVNQNLEADHGAKEAVA